MIRPGGPALTKKAAELAKIPEGARVLDIGCGEGDTVAFLRDELGFAATGVDMSNKIIDRGRTRHKGLDLRLMEAEYLDFESKRFDAVFMECSLSVFRLQDDAVFEAYCVLKPGGKLIISDLYIKNPDPQAVAKMIREADEIASRPKKEGACGENEKPSYVMLDGAFVTDELLAMLEETGFEFEHFSDESETLAGFAAQAIMDHGSLEEYFKAVVPEGEDPAAYYSCAAFKAKKPGYFLMILKKPGEMTYCQSCGMPFDDAHSEFIAKEADGSDSIYCTYCYADGGFLNPDATIEDMIELGTPHLAKKIGEQEAREQLSEFIPTLARWNRQARE